jgi:hypothetical protein
MQPEGSLPCSQKPATGPYPQPDESSPHSDWLTTWSRVLHEKLTVTQLVKKFLIFMQLEGSLPCSQQPATGQYPEPDESSLHSN